jgi:alkyl sulfatase BDS1-like metallo-beta-lactamase superfamily hydrolase
MTIIEGDTGLIVIDPMTVSESAKPGLHRPHKPVVAASQLGPFPPRAEKGVSGNSSLIPPTRVLGWYDGNPANLNPLPPIESPKKTLEYMGGTRSILNRAHKDFADGQYRGSLQC